MDVTKEILVDVVLDVALETILVYGLSYFFSSVAETASAEAMAMTAAYGSSSSYSAAAAIPLAETLTVETAVAVAATLAARSYVRRPDFGWGAVFLSCCKHSCGFSFLQLPGKFLVCGRLPHTQTILSFRTAREFSGFGNFTAFNINFFLLQLPFKISVLEILPHTQTNLHFTSAIFLSVIRKWAVLFPEIAGTDRKTSRQEFKYWQFTGKICWFRTVKIVKPIFRMAVLFSKKLSNFRKNLKTTFSGYGSKPQNHNIQP